MASNKSKGCVVDIETYGTEDDCKILSIGAVIFDEYGDVRKTPPETFHMLVDLDQPGRTVDASTLSWWEKQSEEARMRVLAEDNRVPLEEALLELTGFIRKHKPWFVWGCAPDFDMGILEHAYKSFGGSFPVQFWRWQDVRTVENFVFGKNTRKSGPFNIGCAHDALDDCLQEALVLQMARKQIGEPRLESHILD